MPYTQNTKIRVGRVRSKERVVSKPDHRGRQTVLARPGEEMSVEEAFRREIPAGKLEAVGPGGEEVLKSYRKAVRAKKADESAQILAQAREAGREAERAAARASDEQRSARIRGQDPSAVFPASRGGDKWQLSNGTVFTGTEDEATKAEAAAAAESGDAPASDKVDDVKDWVGDDVDRARTALDAELAKDEKDQRSSLVEHLQKLTEGA